jgi:hypothetical protein
MREMGVMENKPIFLTEAGWIGGGPPTLRFGEVNWLKYTFENIWLDENIVAITPFLLDAQAGDFVDFSFIQNGQFKPFAREIMEIPKTAGKPQLAGKEKSATIPSQWNGSLPPTSKNGWLNFLAQKLLSMLMRK